MIKMSLFLDEKPLGEYSLNKKEILIGRLLKSDIVLDNPAISRKHAKIDLKNNDFYLSDLGSINGVFLKRHYEKRRQRVGYNKLKNGDEIWIEKFMIKVELPNTKMDIQDFKETQWEKSLRDPTKENLDSNSLEGRDATQFISMATLHRKERDEVQKEVYEEVKKKIKITYNRIIRLEFVTSDNKNENSYFPLVSEFTIIGKGSEADILLKGFWVNKEHAVIEKMESGKFIISCSRWFNPLFVNNKKEKEIELDDGDSIRIGNLNMKFCNFVVEVSKEE